MAFFYVLCGNMISYWEQQSFIQYDCIIIGSGIVGLNAAIHLKNKQPILNVCILERGILPSGASTKNAGFACMGSVSELLDDLQSHSDEEVISLFNKRQQGLLELRELLGDENICYTQHGSYELLQEDELSALDEINRLNNLLRPVTKKDAFSIDSSIITKGKFNANIFKHAIANNLEGQIDTGKMMQALIKKALSLGIEIKTGCQVSTINTGNNFSILEVSSVSQTVSLRANQVLICNNAFAKQLIPNLDVTPGRGMVCVTQPIDNLSFQGSYHFKAGYYYFRTINNRVLFGGGRNEAFEAENTYELGLNSGIVASLQQKITEWILPNTTFEIDAFWSGIMGFGKDKSPIIKSINPIVHIGVRCGGMGVAMGILTGRELVDLVDW